MRLCWACFVLGKCFCLFILLNLKLFSFIFFMARYGKGASAERELMRLFSSAGFAVVRSAGSGKNQLPCPDVVVLKGGKVISFECKAWRSKHLVISDQQMRDLFKWRDLSLSETFIAWKYPNKGWFFLPISCFSKRKNYSISFEFAKRVSVPFEVIAGLQFRLFEKC